MSFRNDAIEEFIARLDLKATVLENCDTINDYAEAREYRRLIDELKSLPSSTEGTGETPRTDALFKNLEDKRINVFEAQKAIQDHARQLERELAEQIKHAERIKDAGVKLAEFWEAEAKRTASATAFPPSVLKVAYDELGAAKKAVKDEMDAHTRLGNLYRNDMCASWPRYKKAEIEFYDVLFAVLDGRPVRSANEADSARDKK